jgi:hypothetical protein
MNDVWAKQRVRVTKPGTLQIAAITPFSRAFRLKEGNRPLQSGNRICLDALTDTDSLLDQSILILRTASLTLQSAVL